MGWPSLFVGHVQTFLTPSLPWVIGGFLGLTLWHKKPGVFLRTLSLGMSISLWNSALKGLFKIPLFAHLGPGWACPSGHTHVGALALVWLAWELNHRWAWLGVACYAPLIGLGLILSHYHTALDVMVAYSIVGVEVLILALLTTLIPSLKAPLWWNMITGLFVLATLWLKNDASSLYHQILLGTYALLSLSWLLYTWRKGKLFAL